jgi:chromate transporter
VKDKNATRPTLGQLGRQFLAIGCVSFGGFMALMSVVEDVFVRQKGWIDREDMIDGISLANILPGPQAVNTVTYVGYRLGGLPGALVSFAAILTPTFVLVTLLTFLYFQVAADAAWLERVSRGLLPAVSAVIFSVVWRLRRQSVTDLRSGVIFVSSVAALLLAPAAWKLSVNLGLIVIAGAIGFLASGESGPEQATSKSPPISGYTLFFLLGAPLALLGLYLMGPTLDRGSLPHLALTFSGLSLMLFGGGYVFVPLLQDVVVGQESWLTLQQFTDGIAFSQITPGPIMICAAFVGQKVTMTSHGPFWGVLGGLVCTLAIFAPPALLMIAASGLLENLRSHPGVQAALASIRAAVVGMILVAGWTILTGGLPTLPEVLADHALEAARTLGLFSLSLFLLVRFSANVLVVLPLSGVFGALFF